MHGIVNQTRENFIDVSQKPLPSMDCADVMQRVEMYKQRVNDIILLIPVQPLSASMDESSLQVACLSLLSVFLTFPCQNSVSEDEAIKIEDVGRFVFSFDEV